MNSYFPLEQVVKKRYSVRNYLNQSVAVDKRDLVAEFIAKLENPFGIKIDYHHLDKKNFLGNEKLGTYGVIRGANNYLGATVSDGPMALEALGYELEMIVLYMTHLDLGSCWLGGTFNKKNFIKAMDIDGEKLFPIVISYGYTAEKKHLTERLMRKLVKADQRKSWEELFFHGDFNTPLRDLNSDDYSFGLEMVRLAPSASNKQPWRVVLDGEDLHFYERLTPAYSKSFGYDIQRIDMGIAGAHLALAMKDRGLSGNFKVKTDLHMDTPENTEYIFSWIRD